MTVFASWATVTKIGAARYTLLGKIKQTRKKPEFQLAIDHM
jgi:hypothetical protein